MKIIIETIPHNQQRYPTVGDWFYKMESELTPEGGTTQEILHIKVSDLGDWRYNALIAIHELAEVLACQHEGVTQEQVDKFDTEFEASREDGNEDEPGDSPGAPYRAQHCLATGIERILAAALGVSWKEYEETINSLP